MSYSNSKCNCVLSKLSRTFVVVVLRVRLWSPANAKYREEERKKKLFVAFIVHAKGLQLYGRMMMLFLLNFM